jgi:hypothetical protein
MTKSDLIKIVIAAIAGVLAKEIISWLLRQIKSATPTVKAKFVPWLQKYFGLLDGFLSLIVASYIGYLAFYVSGLPARSHQIFWVAFLMVVAFEELRLSATKIAQWFAQRRKQ